MTLDSVMMGRKLILFLASISVLMINDLLIDLIIRRKFPGIRLRTLYHASVLNHCTLEFRDFSKRAPGSCVYDRSTYF